MSVHWRKCAWKLCTFGAIEYVWFYWCYDKIIWFFFNLAEAIEIWLQSIALWNRLIYFCYWLCAWNLKYWTNRMYHWKISNAVCLSCRVFNLKCNSNILFRQGVSVYWSIIFVYFQGCQKSFCTWPIGLST